MSRHSRNEWLAASDSGQLQIDGEYIPRCVSANKVQDVTGKRWPPDRPTDRLCLGLSSESKLDSGCISSSTRDTELSNDTGYDTMQSTDQSYLRCKSRYSSGFIDSDFPLEQKQQVSQQSLVDQGYSSVLNTSLGYVSGSISLQSFSVENKTVPSRGHAAVPSNPGSLGDVSCTLGHLTVQDVLPANFEAQDAPLTDFARIKTPATTNDTIKLLEMKQVPRLRGAHNLRVDTNILDSGRNPSAVFDSTKTPSSVIRDAKASRVKTPETENPSHIRSLYDMNSEMDSVLHLLVIHKQPGTLRDVLTSQQFNPILLTTPNKLSQTPLHLAVIINEPSIVRLFITYGAPVDVKDKRGNTPLHIASERGYLDCAKELVRPITPQEVHGRRYPLPFHQIPQDESIMNYDGLTCFHLAVINRCVDVAQVLHKDCYANVNCQNGRSGETPLHTCVVQNDFEMIKFLLETFKRDLNVNARRYDGSTPADLASGFKHAEALRLLRKSGATRPSADEDCLTDEDEDMDLRTDVEMTPTQSDSGYSDSVITDSGYDDFIIDGTMSSGRR